MTTTLAEPIGSATWRRYAACADVDPELFFPLNSRSQDIPRAVSICRHCPVKAHCLAETEALPPHRRFVGMIAGGNYYQQHYPTRSTA